MPNLDAVSELEEIRATVESDTISLLKTVNHILRMRILPKHLQAELMEEAGKVETWYETEDPVQMGWVGSDGRP